MTPPWCHDGVMDLTPYVDTLRRELVEAAGREGLSVNAWLVRAVSAAVEGGGAPRATERTRSVGQSFTGWVR
jgi:hypothetical protein